MTFAAKYGIECAFYLVRSLVMLHTLQPVTQAGGAENAGPENA